MGRALRRSKMVAGASFHSEPFPLEGNGTFDRLIRVRLHAFRYGH
jgi:hypothetical protein